MSWLSGLGRQISSCELKSYPIIIISKKLSISHGHSPFYSNYSICDYYCSAKQKLTRQIALVQQCKKDFKAQTLRLMPCFSANSTVNWLLYNKWLQ